MKLLAVVITSDKQVSMTLLTTRGTRLNVDVVGRNAFLHTECDEKDLDEVNDFMSENFKID